MPTKRITHVNVKTSTAKLARGQDQPRKVELPPALKKALAGDPAAKAAFEKLAPSHQREYVRWVSEAKQEATHLRRLEKMRQMLLAGKKPKA